MLDTGRLDSITTFPKLVDYLREELDWPIDRESFDDLTYDYTPEELGLKLYGKKGRIEIKQLRPLVPGQPWGIFFLNFPGEKLPVTVLRRILGKLALKKRATANAAERAAWQKEDLLFISSHGEAGHRQLTFAHFHEDRGHGDLPTLKVLGWDGQNTLRRLSHTHDTLKRRLRWPEDQTALITWREIWGGAFTEGVRQSITTAKSLAQGLAHLADQIRARANVLLEAETDKGPLQRLLKAFQKALIHDLDEDGFADMYAQTIAYGLLSARISRASGALVADNVTDLAPATNPFLKELLETFLKAGGRNGGMDFDELGVNDVVEMLRQANMEAVLRDFDDHNPQEDPVIHFYELFLKEYDARKRMQRGVFYTPRPVVSYIVRSVDELLRNEFGLDDGIADTATWGEMTKRHKALQVPEGISPEQEFVQILDPATGTGTFLVEVIDLIHKTLVAKWKALGRGEKEIDALWNHYVPKHLLTRLHGYELLMAPYAIAHLKIGLKLYETGYRFESDERARIYLTNALEPPQDLSGRFDFAIPALAHEAQSVNTIKEKQRFTIVIGNPPYSGISANMSDAIIELVEPYKHINGVPLGERKIWAQDDYKKFIRFSQLAIANAGCGVLGFITNHGYISEPTSRGMRHNLLNTFPRISILDLHGSLKKREICPDGTPDRNVFDIEPGVAVSLLRRGPAMSNGISHGELWGTRETKYEYLFRNTLGTTRLSVVSPSPNFYLFLPQNEDAKTEFEQFLSVTDVFGIGSNGIQTSRDHVVYGFKPAECRGVIEGFRLAESSLSTRDLREKYWPGKKVANYPAGDTRGWRVQDARQDLRQDGEWDKKFRRTLYRPFDFRTLFYAEYMIDWPRTEVMSQMTSRNLSLCVGRAGSAADNQEWNIVFVADTLVDMNLFYRGGNVNYPLRFASISDGLAYDSQPRPNYKAGFLKSLSRAIALSQTKENGLPTGVTPEAIFQYVYAIFFSPAYRKRYAEFLKIDFPRLPLPRSLELFRALGLHGGELIALHLLRSPKLEQSITRYIGDSVPEIEKISWSDNAVWLDKSQSNGFVGVSQTVWNFHIGGYQVCEKWLKDRKERTLSKSDIIHYQKIVVAVAETIRIMKEIDEVIAKHGGWPGAFQSNAVPKSGYGAVGGTQ